jgi:hypothetical protein
MAGREQTEMPNLALNLTLSLELIGPLSRQWT